MLTSSSQSESSNLLEKDASIMSFTPKAGFAHREKASSTPLNEQFVWIAKLDSHENKFDEFLEAIKEHAGNVERSEKGTLSFLVLQSHDSKNSVTLFERYTSEDYFNNVHHNSENMEKHSKKVRVDVLTNVKCKMLTRFDSLRRFWPNG